jgi:hypothetical protein
MYAALPVDDFARWYQYCAASLVSRRVGTLSISHWVMGRFLGVMFVNGATLL